MKLSFAAPWGKSLKAISLLSTMLLLAITALIPVPAAVPPLFPGMIRLFPVVLLGACALFTLRGYEVTAGWLQVRRLFWATRIPLRTLTAAEWRRGPFGWAWRTCGNGGLYSFSGWYWQKSLGSFRALATRIDDAVILTFSDRKPLVVTPDDPGGCVEAIKAGAASLPAPPGEFRRGEPGDELLRHERVAGRVGMHAVAGKSEVRSRFPLLVDEHIHRPVDVDHAPAFRPRLQQPGGIAVEHLVVAAER